jgi:hypothetical protein
MNTIRLSAKVQARNESNAAALRYAPAILEMLTQFIGKSILLRTGGRSAKLDKAITALDLPNYSNTNRKVQVVIRVERYWFRADFNTTVLHDEGCEYSTTTVTLGTVEDYTLTRVSPNPKPENTRTDFTVAEILAARAEVEAAQFALRTAEHKLCGFGER